MKKKSPTRFHHANRYEQYSANFLRFLERYLQGFKQEPVDVRRALCVMIFEAPTRHRAHSHHEGYSRFGFQELEQSFGRTGFAAINDRLGLFEVLQEVNRDDWSMVEGRTKAYKLTEKVAAIHEKFLNGSLKRGATRLMTQDGKYLQSPPASAMMAKNQDGQNRRGFQNLPVKPLVPVNLVQLKKLIVDIEARLLAHEAGFGQSEMFSGMPDIAFLKALRQNTQMIFAKARHAEWHGYVVHRYFETESGRVYAKGDANLQNCYRVLREAAMAGLYDIDIENCHYSILAQMAASHGYQCTAIQSYLDNKEPLRKGIAAGFGISVQQAKDALIALIYGAKFSSRAKDALPRIFNGDVALAGRIYLYPKFMALRDDIAGARAVILKAQEVSRRTITNCRGLTMRLDGSNVRQQLAHLLQGVEVTALESAYRLYPNEIVLLQHDGFAATRPLDTERIEKAMLEATGYTLKIEQKVIQVNLAAAFDGHPEAANNQNEKEQFLQ